MAGTRLRALLDDPAFNLLPPSSPSTAPVKILDDQTFDLNKINHNGIGNSPSSAMLFGNSSIWSAAGEEEDFNLEYMDLDEFLTETGLDVNEAGLSNVLMPNQPKSLPSSPRSDCSSHLEALLHNNSPTIPQDVGSPQKVIMQQLEPITVKTVAKELKTASDQTGFVKKRKYEEDGESLSDTAVVVIPGKDGFNPASTRFTPEDLQPQPIIKKSRKTFVPESNKDDKYWKRRNKNNVAAKRSREARRAKENQIIMRASFLEDENARLNNENTELTQQNEKLMKMIEELQTQLK